MLRGFYSAASGMITQQRQQDALSNNIANVNTPGYKGDQVAIQSFPEMLIQEMNGKQIGPANKNIPFQQEVGSLSTGTYVQEMIPHFSQGDLRETGLDTDLALVHNQLPDENGSVFFTVQAHDGSTQLTRNGNFAVDEEGSLVSNEGLYVLNQDGNPIQIGGQDFQVTPEGMIATEEGSTTLGVTYIENTDALEKQDNGLYTGAEGIVPPNGSFTIEQGFLEGSNVDLMQVMTQMMESYRMFETNQRVLKAYDQSMEKTVNEIGRIG